MIDADAMKGALIVMFVFAAIAGWAVIEFVLWVFSHISIVWQ